MSRQTTEVRKVSTEEGEHWSREVSMGTKWHEEAFVLQCHLTAVFSGFSIPVLSTWGPLPHKVSCFGEKKKCCFGKERWRMV